MADGFALGPHYTRHVEQENTITSVVLNGLCGPPFFIGGKNGKNPRPGRSFLSMNQCDRADAAWN